MAGKRNRQGLVCLEALRADIQRYPDSYLYERGARFGVSRMSILRAMRKLGITRKKKR